MSNHTINSVIRVFIQHWLVIFLLRYLSILRADTRTAFCIDASSHLHFAGFGLIGGMIILLLITQI